MPRWSVEGTEGGTIRRTPRHRRQVRPATLRLARILGFRYDPGRDAFVLRLVGNRWGPVLKSEPVVDGAAESLDWTDELQRAAERPRTGRFRRRRRAVERDASENVLRR